MRLGRLPVKPPHLRLPIGWANDYLTVPLPEPQYPIDVRGPSAGDMWGNSVEGDCGEAGLLYLELATAARSGVVPLPSWSEQAAIGEYLSYTGGQDTGVVLADFLHWLWQKGRIKAFAPAPHTDRRTLDGLMQLTGQALYCGVSLTSHDEADFGVRPWGSEGTTPDPQLGHCVCRVFADGAAVDRWRTWGAFQDATLTWGDACLDEAWVVVTTDEQLAVFSPQLLADIAALGGTGGTQPPAPAPQPAPPPPPPPPAPLPPAPAPKAALSLRATAGSWSMTKTGAGAWTLTAHTAAASAASAVTSWLSSAALKVAGAFLLVFLPMVAIAASTNVLSVSSIHAAAVAGIAAALTALDALIGNVINPGSASTAHAVRVVRGRRWQRRAWEHYQQLAPPD